MTTTLYQWKYLQCERSPSVQDASDVPDSMKGKTGTTLKNIIY